MLHKRNTTHQFAKRGNVHPVYKIWLGIKKRCYNPAYVEWHLYGGRGISMDAVWMTFENFMRDMGPTWKPGLSIDRIDPEKNYEPGNCRWCDAVQQANNKRNNHWLEFNGERKTISQWAKSLGMKDATLWMRIKSGWPIEKALTTPVAVPPQRRTIPHCSTIGQGELF